MVIQGNELLSAIINGLLRQGRRKYNKQLLEFPILCENLVKKIKVQVEGREITVSINTKGIINKVDEVGNLFPEIFIVGIIPKSLFDFLLSLGLLIFRSHVKFSRNHYLCILPHLEEYEFSLHFFYVAKQDEQGCLLQMMDKVAEILSLRYRVNTDDLLNHLIDDGLVEKDRRGRLIPKTSANILLEHLIKTSWIETRSKEEEKLYRRRCIFCDSEFFSKRKHALFCSDKCMWAFERKLTRYGLRDELRELRERFLEEGLGKGEAKEKAYLSLVKEYPSLKKSKAKGSHS